MESMTRIRSAAAALLLLAVATDARAQSSFGLVTSGETGINGSSQNGGSTLSGFSIPVGSNSPGSNTTTTVTNGSNSNSSNGNNSNSASTLATAGTTVSSGTTDTVPTTVSTGAASDTTVVGGTTAGGNTTTGGTTTNGGTTTTGGNTTTGGTTTNSDGTTVDPNDLNLDQDNDLTTETFSASTTGRSVDRVVTQLQRAVSKQMKQRCRAIGSTLASERNARRVRLNGQVDALTITAGASAGAYVGNAQASFTCAER